MKSLQNNVELSACRLEVVEQRNETTLRAAEALRLRITALQKELVAEQRRCEKLEAECSRKDRANQVILASKHYEREEILRLGKEVGEVKQLAISFEQSYRDASSKRDEAERKVRELQQVNTELSTRLAGYNDKFKAQKADICAQDLLIAQLSGRISEMESSYRLAKLQLAIPAPKPQQAPPPVSKDDLLPGSKLYTVNMQLKQSEAMVESLKKQLQQAQLQIELYSNNSR